MASTYPGPAKVPTPNVSNAASVLVAPANPSRTSLYVFNPGANVIWVAPDNDFNQAVVVAIAGGNGSVPVQPLQGMLFPGFTNGMVAIAAAGATNVLTIWENYL